jgi:cell division protein FtsI (penicillin-binding protein 3)
VHADPQDNFHLEAADAGAVQCVEELCVGGAQARSGDGEAGARAEPEGRLLQKEFKRFYPNNDLAAQVLGYVGTDDTGWAGWSRSSTTTCMASPGTC